MTANAIKVGDRFYYNSYSVSRKHALPDMMQVLEVRDNDTMRVKYEYRTIGPKEVECVISKILSNSNRNPECKDPLFIFVEDKKR